MADEPEHADTEKTSDTPIIDDDSVDQEDLAAADVEAVEDETAGLDEADAKADAQADDEDDAGGKGDAGEKIPSADWSARLGRHGTRNPLRRLSRVGRALVASGLVVAALAGLTGWLGYRAYELQQASALRNLFVQTARQGAVNLTTINFTQIDTDVQRILDLATGAFREDFERRSKPFIELVKASQSKSEGTVTDAGLESQQGDSGQVLVAVSVKSRTAAGEEAPREWRMKIEVKAVGDEAKMTSVVFVP